MAMKRRILNREEEEEDGGADIMPRTKRPTLMSVGREVMQLQLMQRLLVPILEPTIRRAVREEVEHAFLRLAPSAPRISINQIQASGARGWYLHFNTRLPHTLFTGSLIPPVEIVLRHADSGETIRSEAFPSIKVQIVVLESDFGQDEQEDWTKEEFDANIVSERTGKRPLLTGELVITLRDGVGYFEKVSFTDNSSWTKSRRFRLGVKVAQSSGIEERIREARSEAFIVKDHRGELYKKHESPSLGDEVWRLKNIGKDGAFRKRLSDNGIETVQQFLRSWVIDADSLRTLLGNGMSNKAWEETVQHARKCVLDNKLYKYYNAGLQVGLLLDSIFQVVALTFDFQSFQYLNELTQHQMLVDTLKQLAYKDQERIVELDALLPVSPLRPLPELQAASDPGSSLILQNPDLITAQEEQAMPFNFVHPTNPPHPQLIIDSPMPKGNEGMQDLQLGQPLPPFQDNSFSIANLLPGPYVNYGNSWSASGSAGTTAAADGQLLGWDYSQKLNLFNGSYQVSGNEMAPSSFLNLSPLNDLGVHMSGNCKVNKGWRKLGAPLKWGVLVRKNVAARRMAGFCS
ncbi:calmodulin-binding protein 60 B-like isoform X2 [Magnolia sinica]|uniref:calmodulin-binding protein 60 B-like isoform X2 n=1 Tax=Magnolia sinica TaxID=86752 RepID=UPI00265B6EE6|nr:calmodulin-binding protein 60 B-like isoform X2 [Magnolia sinica]